MDDELRSPLKYYIIHSGTVGPDHLYDGLYRTGGDGPIKLARKDRHGHWWLTKREEKELCYVQDPTSYKDSEELTEEEVAMIMFSARRGT